MTKPLQKKCPVEYCGKIIKGLTEENINSNMESHIKFKHPDYKQKESEKQ